MILAVVGPTGVGKTKMSIALAKKYNGIIINCDAVQIYKEMNIGSAKILDNEKEGIPHFLFDIKYPNEEYTVKDYQSDLRILLEKYHDRNIIIVGGTGLYLSAGILDYRFDEESEALTYEALSNEELYTLCLAKDPHMEIHENNRVRLVRFLNRNKREEVKAEELYDVKIIGLTTARDNLYTIINKRVDQMIEDGLIEEVRYLNEKYPQSRVLTTAIGYKEIKAYLNEEISKEEAIAKIKQNSRHYAKRQYTWFNNKMDVKWFMVNYVDFNKTIEKVIEFIGCDEFEK